MNSGSQPDPDLPMIVSVEIVDEHQLLDDAGTVWSIRVTLDKPFTPEGRRLGFLEVTETAGAKNRRRLTHAVHRTQGPVLETGFSVVAEKRPKRGPYLIKRPRRLAAILQLLSRGAQLNEYGGYSELIWNDRDERAGRDRLGRQWTIHEVATSSWGGSLVRASCRWPDRRLSGPCDLDLRNHHVFEIGGKIIDRRFGFPVEIDGIDEKTRRRLTASLNNGQWASLTRPSLSEMLTKASAGFASLADARAVFGYLRAKNYVMRHDMVRRDANWREELSSAVDIAKLEIIEQREVCVESYNSQMQTGELYLVRVTLAAVRGKRQVVWLALHAGNNNDLPVLRDLANDRATCLTLAESWRELVGRLLDTRTAIDSWLGGEEDWTEANARRAWTTAIAEDDRRRRRREHLGRRFTLLARAALEDGRQVLRLSSEWTRVDALLASSRPTQHVLVIGADGIDVVNLDSGDGQRSYNASSNEPTNVTEALEHLTGQGGKAEDARWHLDYLLKTCEGGFTDTAAADQAWEDLVGAPVSRYAIPATETWTMLWVKRGSLLPEVVTEPAPPDDAVDSRSPSTGARDETSATEKAMPEVAIPVPESPAPEMALGPVEESLPPPVVSVSAEALSPVTAISEPGAVPRDETMETTNIRRRRGRPVGAAPAKTSTERSRQRRERLRKESDAPPAKGGRPPKGDKSMTPGERSKQYRQRLAARGMALLRVKVPKDKTEAVKAAIERILEEDK